MQFTHLHLSTIPLEEAHGGSGARQMLIKREYLTTPYLEVITKGFLKPGNMFDWHNHKDTDEIFIVTQGSGAFFYKENNEEKSFSYAVDDVIIAPANIFHKIVAEGDKETEGFFFRIKAIENVEHNHKVMQLHIGEIPFEAVHEVPESRQTLVTSDVVATDYLEAITKGTLRAGNMWDWHEHQDSDEVSIVLHGQGNYFIDDEKLEYKTGDIFVVPAETVHKIESTQNSEFFFIRVKK